MRACGVRLNYGSRVMLRLFFRSVALVCAMDGTSPRLPQVPLLAISSLVHHAPPFRRYHLHVDSATLHGTHDLLRVRTLSFLRTAIARSYFRAKAVACRIRRSYACRYLPTIARASPAQYPLDGRCTLWAIPDVVTKSKSRIFGSTTRSIRPDNGRLHAGGRATNRRNDNDVSSRSGRRRV